MVFGEIVEPSSRALWEDDFVDYPEDDGVQLEWNNNLEVPKLVNKLIIGETSRIVDVLQKCVLEPFNPVAELVTAGILIYKIKNDSYVITYKAEPKIIVGQVTEKLIPWLTAAKEVTVITSAPITSLQNSAPIETCPCIIRRLSSKKSSDTSYLKLEVPNLVTGLCASVLTYCIYKQLTCSLYIGFLDEVPLDSLNTQALLDLLRYLEISPLKPYYLKDKPPSNNLYM